MGRDKRPLLEHWQKVSLLLMIYDIIAVTVAYFFALWIRFDCVVSAIPDYYVLTYQKFMPIYWVICVATFWFTRLYNSVWRFASFDELMSVIKATVITVVLHILLINLLFIRMPISYHVVGAGIQFIAVLGVRFSYRLVLLLRKKVYSDGPNREPARVMLIGAGNAGQMILRDAGRVNKNNVRICCIIDDNPNKWNRYIDGVPVVGGRNDILSNVEKYGIEKIFVAIPSASKQDLRDILNICKETGCALQNLPGMEQLIAGEASLSDLREVAVEDLLGREPVRVDMDQILDSIRDKTILVTGGGGSIGSELCRQVAGHGPRQLVIFDVYENNAYEIQQELKEAYPELNLTVLIGSVRDSRRIDRVFETYKPDIVYHAAAHKHVPLMEDSPCEAVKNNVIGTYKTAYAAMKHNCGRFVLISTDKAVNPTNIMGASKRLCEMVIQSFDRMVKLGAAGSLPQLYTHSVEDDEPLDMKQCRFCTEFVAVRFGNVLGSNGSVIPLFKKQIAKGGPVTVTHPDIIRYFMTIPEAVSLVLQAGCYARGGEIFVLDMGEPVKIDDLARNLIKLSGQRPDEDIQLVYTGLRPGEKLYEEKLMAEEGLRRTENDLIHVGNPIPIDVDDFIIRLKKLMDAAYDNDERVRELVEEMVPGYQPAVQ